MILLSVAEAELLANAAILRHVTEGVIVTDLLGTIKFVNEAAAEIHGIAEINVKPNAYSRTYHLYRENGQPYPSHELPLARAVRGDTVKDARWRIRRPDGGEVLAIGTAQPLHAPDGRRIGAILTLRDHTKVDALERALRENQMALREAQRLLAEHAADARDAEAATALAQACRAASLGDDIDWNGSLTLRTLA